MKRCPECRRDYTGETLNFCLDDGATLLDGPASVDEPATAVFGVRPSGGIFSESQTRPQIDAKAEAEPQVITKAPTVRHSQSAHRTAKPLAALVLTILILFGGFFGFQYLGPANSKQIDSIAVMPFVNESGNPEAEYLSDGISEALISSLSRLPELSVRARSSVYRYKGKDISPRTLGNELNVQAVLNGRIFQRGGPMYSDLIVVEGVL